MQNIHVELIRAALELTRLQNEYGNEFVSENFKNNLDWLAALGETIQLAPLPNKEKSL